MAETTRKTIQTDLLESSAIGAANSMSDPVELEDTDFIPSKQQLAQLGQCLSVLSALDQDATKAAFVAGEAFATAKAILPKKQFGDWCASKTSYTVRAAWNFIAVHERFSAQKERLIKASVPPTSLIGLIKASNDVVEQVVAAFESGERLTGAQIKAMISGKSLDVGSKGSGAVYDQPGVAGLKKVAERKQAAEIEDVIERSKCILAKVLKALEPLEQGRAVRKGELEKAIHYECINLSALMRHLLLPLVGEEDKEAGLYIGSLPKGTTWAKVRAIIDLLSEDSGRWPPRAQFVDWLQDEVVPAFRFILEGTPMPEFEHKTSMPNHAPAVSAEEENSAEVTPFVSRRHRTPANDDAAEVYEQRVADAMSDAGGDH